MFLTAAVFIGHDNINAGGIGSNTMNISMPNIVLHSAFANDHLNLLNLCRINVNAVF